LTAYAACNGSHHNKCQCRNRTTRSLIVAG
jgi:hypothetical protein